MIIIFWYGVEALWPIFPVCLGVLLLAYVLSLFKSLVIDATILQLVPVNSFRLTFPLCACVSALCPKELPQQYCIVYMRKMQSEHIASLG